MLKIEVNGDSIRMEIPGDIFTAISEMSMVTTKFCEKVSEDTQLSVADVMFPIISHLWVTHTQRNS